MSLYEIAKEYRCSSEAVRKLMIKFNMERRDTNEYHKWKCPPNQIKPIIYPSPILSYILGVLVGDGWTYKYRYNYFIGLDSTEKEFCIEFLRALKHIGLHPSLINRGKKGWRTVVCSKIFLNWYISLNFESTRI